MSMISAQLVSCPSCEHDFEMESFDSVNADRRPDLRDSILGGTLQVQACPKCAASFRLEPKLNYLDLERSVWVSAQPLQELGQWVEREDEAVATFNEAYGPQAPASARDVGGGLKPRLTFGWAALREKLLAQDAGLDDTTLELAKLAIIRGAGGAPIQPGVELRLMSVADDQLQMSWIDARTEKVVEGLLVPRAVYDSVVAAPEAWAPFRAQLSGGPFVDVQKLFIGEGRGG
jgi:CpXC protein